MALASPNTQCKGRDRGRGVRGSSTSLHSRVSCLLPCILLLLTSSDSATSALAPTAAPGPEALLRGAGAGLDAAPAAAPAGGQAKGAEAPVGASRGDEEDANGYRKWPAVDVVSLGGATDFGWVVTSGPAFKAGTVNEKVCGLIAARTKSGQPFDKGEEQEAFFVGYVTTGNVRMVADIDYLPARSMHQLCFTPPVPGTYALAVRLGFVNYHEITTTRVVETNGGFAGYTLVLLADVSVTSADGGEYNLWAYRGTLPVCTSQLLAESSNRGFWVAKTWMPQACRLTRMEPSGLLQCLNGKNILMIGDSEVRYLFGLLQLYASYPSRQAFITYGNQHPFQRGAFLDTLGVPTTVSNLGPPLNETTNSAIETSWDFLNGTSTFFGGIYEGFSRRQVDTQLGGDNVAFNLTYSSYFSIGLDVFAPWKLGGALTKGTRVTDGLPYDLIFVANQLHDVEYFDSAEDYVKRLTTFAIPNLKAIMKSPDSFFMYGGLASYEARKPNALYLSGNPRIVAFEDAGYDALTGAGLPNFLKVRYVTASRPDLAYDSTHYELPVNLAMLDLWLGSNCPTGDNAQ